jgi:hypothetical protein
MILVLKESVLQLDSDRILLPNPIPNPNSILIPIPIPNPILNAIPNPRHHEYEQVILVLKESVLRLVGSALGLGLELLFDVI